MTTDRSLDDLRRMMEARAYEWSHAKKTPPVRPGPVITISREPGCRDEAIADKLSAELGLHLYGWEIVEQIAKDEHVSVQVVSALEEKGRSELEDWLHELRGTHNLSLDAYFEDLHRIIFAIASHGNALILGRGANFFLPPKKRIAIILMAPLDVRTRNIMEDHELSEELAWEHIDKLEKEYRRYVKKYFDADIRDSVHYHLAINTAMVSPETIVGIVKEIIRQQS